MKKKQKPTTKFGFCPKCVSLRRFELKINSKVYWQCPKCGQKRKYELPGHSSYMGL